MIMDPEELEREVIRLKLDLSGRKDNIDELILKSDRISTYFPSPLIHHLKEVLSLQASLTKAHIESVKSGNFKVHHNKELSGKLLEVGLDVPTAKINNGIQRIDFTFPFLLNSPEVFKVECEKYRSEGVESRSTDDEQSVSVPLSNIFHTSASSTNPITVKMLKDNPEEHGLNKDVLDGFSDDPEIIDIQVKIRGRRKRVKAFKDGHNILIPCTEKNCSHTQLDFNDVSICPNKTKIPKLQLQTDFDGIPQLSAFPDLSVLHQVPSSSADSSGFQNMSKDSISSPQIMSVKSLAPNFPSRLNPLASQLPNPIRKNTSMTVVNSHLMIEHPNQMIFANAISRPSILSKSGQTVSANGSVMPIILLPTNNNNKRKSNPCATMGSPAACTFINLPSSLRQFTQLPQTQIMGETASQLQKSVQRANVPISIAPAPPPVPMETEVTIYPLDSDNEDPDALKIESVFNASSNQNQTNNHGVEFIKEINKVKSTSESADIEKDVNAYIANDEENEGDAAPNATPFNFATNIFEEIDEQDNEIDEPESNVFAVPQIVSTAGGVVFPFSAPQNNNERMIVKKLHRVRRKIVGTAEGPFPDRQLVAGIRYNCCRFCGIVFTAASLNLYRVHMTSHIPPRVAATADGKEPAAEIEQEKPKVQISIQPKTTSRPTLIPLTKPTLIPIMKQTPMLVAKPTTEWYKCKKCDQIMKQKDTVDHLVTCCPSLGEDAFVVIQMVAESGALRTERDSSLPFFCGLCEKSYESLDVAKRHLRDSHNDIHHKILLEPVMRCAYCLEEFVDSVHLTIHCSTCNNRRASVETMFKLAQAMLHCDVCKKSHETISDSQDCYTKTGHIRCVLCLYTFSSRGCFFNHINDYHFRGNIGISCPFCDIGEISIRDCFIHILESHYSPILMYSTTSSSGVTKGTDSTETGDSSIKEAVFNNTFLTSRLGIPTSQTINQSRPTHRLISVVRSTPPASQTMTPTPRLIRLRAVAPHQISRAMTSTNSGQTQTITIRAGQLISGVGTSNIGQSIIRQVQLANSQTGIRPFQISSASQTTVRQPNPILLAPSGMTTSNPIIRQVIPTTPLGTSSTPIIRQAPPTTTSGITTSTQVSVTTSTQLTGLAIPAISSEIRQDTPTPSSGEIESTQVTPQPTPTTSVGMTTSTQVNSQTTPTTSTQVIPQATLTISSGMTALTQATPQTTQTSFSGMTASTEATPQTTQTSSSRMTTSTESIQKATPTTTSGMTTTTELIKKTTPITSSSGMSTSTKLIRQATPTTSSGIKMSTHVIRQAPPTTSSGTRTVTHVIRQSTPTTSSGMKVSTLAPATLRIRPLTSATSSPGITTPTPIMRSFTPSPSPGMKTLTQIIRQVLPATSPGTKPTMQIIRPSTATAVSMMKKLNQIMRDGTPVTSSETKTPTRIIRQLTPVTSLGTKVSTQVTRQATPTTLGGTLASTQIKRAVVPTTSSGVSTPHIIRPLRPFMRGANATIGATPIRGGTIQAITPAQLQRSPIISAAGVRAPSVRVNLSSLNLLSK